MTCLFFPERVHDSLELPCNLSVAFFLVRQCTSAAVFYAVFQDSKATPAFFAQCIQRAIAKQAVELLQVNALMTGEIFTLPVAEKRKVFAFPVGSLLFAHTIHHRHGFAGGSPAVFTQYSIPMSSCKPCAHSFACKKKPRENPVAFL